MEQLQGAFSRFFDIEKSVLKEWMSYQKFVRKMRKERQTIKE
jgi:hypothetical protein